MYNYSGNMYFLEKNIIKIRRTKRALQSMKSDGVDFVETAKIIKMIT